ncbi:MAG: 1,4-dihydroxy-2-naphthoyl-CoA hydrolase [Oscillatoriales cyanobacterium CG2_30_44_21]|nr:MAG: 1,4-dihydroxy-2-naphthoyl-CoA hydrolase [Oscillatoriales cyanobacterium CG2_30_44_21]
MKNFIYDRTIHFRDTDAAGVVYFANVLAICHEAYETSLVASGIDLKSFFTGNVAVPITSAKIDFFKPMFCGDHLKVLLDSNLISADSFEIKYQIFFDGESQRAIAIAETKHTCIDSIIRKRISLSPQLLQWIKFNQ